MAPRPLIFDKSSITEQAPVRPVLYYAHCAVRGRWQHLHPSLLQLLFLHSHERRHASEQRAAWPDGKRDGIHFYDLLLAGRLDGGLLFAA